MFHLITHAFFKALLFLGAGSVIHGCSGEQDIRHMGGLKKSMRVTWLVYTAGTLALCGVVPFAGFWSKDEILHAAFIYNLTRVPYYLGAFGALLTAFYMTRQYIYVFFGSANRPAVHQDFKHEEPAAIEHGHHAPHESPAVMTVPLIILSFFAVLLGFIGAPFWPWIESFLEGGHAAFRLAALTEAVPLLLVSTLIVVAGIGAAWMLYGRKPITDAGAPDILDAAQPQLFRILNHAFYVDAFYKATFVRLNDWAAAISDWFDRWVWNGAVQTVSYTALAFAWFDNFVDTNVVNGGFDEGCETVSRSGKLLSPSAKRKSAELPAHDWARLNRPCRHPAMGGARMIRPAHCTAYRRGPCLARPRKQQKACSMDGLGFSLVILLLAAAMWHRFDPASSALQFQEHHAWIPALNIEYRVGVDGLGAADGVAVGDRSSHGHGCIVEDRRPRLAVLRARPAFAGLPLRRFHCVELCALVHLLGTESRTGILPDQDMGRTQADTSGDPVSGLHHGR